MVHGCRDKRVYQKEGGVNLTLTGGVFYPYPLGRLVVTFTLHKSTEMHLRLSVFLNKHFPRIPEAFMRRMY